MQALLTEARLLGPPPPAVFAEGLASLTLEDLKTVERLLASSPHNRQLCSEGGALNSALALLPRFDDAPRRAAALRIIRHLGNHRFTVHNMRFVLAAVARNLDAAAGSDGGASTSAALELLQLMVDVLASSPGPAELPAFWDMGVGVMGATGFDLPADRLIHLASKGGVTISCWIRLDQLGASPTAVFGIA